jgi:RNA polymerase primary sigma factor
MKPSTGRSGRAEWEELAPYLDALRRTAPLSREEEHRLAVKARRGDVAAR